MECAVCGDDVTVETPLVPDFLLDSDEDVESNRLYFCIDHNDMYEEGHIGICLNKEEFIIKRGSNYHSIDSEYEFDNINERYIKEANKGCEDRLKMKLGIISIPGSEHWCDG